MAHLCFPLIVYLLTISLPSINTDLLHPGGLNPTPGDRSSDYTQAEILHLTSLAMEMASHYWTNPDAFAQIYTIMEKVKMLQMNHSFLRTSDAERREAIRRLVAWAQEKFSLDGVTVKDSQEGKGYAVYSTRQLDAGEIFLKVPLNYTIRAKMYKPKANKCFGDAKLYDYSKFNVWETSLYLALQLISERLNPTSHLKPYLDSLPTQFGTAAYFTPQSLGYLEGTGGAYEDIIWTYDELIMQYTTLYQRLVANQDNPACQAFLFQPQTFTYELYQWAVSNALTRNLIEGGVGSFMIPLWDCVNHHNHIHSIWQKVKYDYSSREDGYLVAWIQTGINPGDQMFGQYKSVWTEMKEFYSQWDIINEDAPVQVEVKILPVDKTYYAKKNILKARKLDTTNQLNISPKLPNMPMFPSEFETLLITATGKVLDKMEQQDWHESWRFLKKRVEIQLYFYMYKPEEIRQKLQQASLDYPSRQALLYSQTEQTSLRKTLERLENMISDPGSYIDPQRVRELQKQDDEEYELYKQDPPTPPGFKHIKPLNSQQEL